MVDPKSYNKGPPIDMFLSPRIYSATFTLAAGALARNWRGGIHWIFTFGSNHGSSPDHSHRTAKNSASSRTVGVMATVAGQRYVCGDVPMRPFPMWSHARGPIPEAEGGQMLLPRGVRLLHSRATIPAATWFQSHMDLLHQT